LMKEPKGQIVGSRRARSNYPKGWSLTQNKAITAARSALRTADAASTACTMPAGSGW
jgi:hypothetical protein